MIKDKFEIEIGKRLRATEAPVPAGSWEAIRAGIKSSAGIPAQNAAPFSNSGFVVGLIAGAAMLISLVVYTGQESKHISGNANIEQTTQETSVAKSPVTVILKADKSQASTIAEEIEVENLNTNTTQEVNSAVNQAKNHQEESHSTPRRVFTAKPIHSNTTGVIDSQDANTTEQRTLAAKAVSEQSKSAVNAMPAKAKIIANKISGYAPLTVQFNNKAAGLKYYWEFGYKTDSYEKSPEVIFEEPGVYTVYLTVENAKGEIAEDFLQVTVNEGSEFFVPDAITPNGDGKNDTYKVAGININEFYMIITDQNGNAVFESREINREWIFDRSIHGLNGAKYFVSYRAVGVDGKVYSGDRKVLNILY